MNSQIARKIDITLDENQLLQILIALADSKDANKDWNYRSDKIELYSQLFNLYADLVRTEEVVEPYCGDCLVPINDCNHKVGA